MLNIHILNVGNGDSIIIEYRDNNGSVSFGLIDSNIDKGPMPPALAKLQELGATKLSFISLTHPHCDHYTGLAQIFTFYKNNIDTFYSFPVGAYINGRLRKIATLYKELCRVAGTEKKKKQLLEFIEIITSAHKYVKNWEEPRGFMSPIAPSGFTDVELYVLLPLAKIKGKYFEMIESGSYDILNINEKYINQLSMAFYIKYKGNEIILAGDGNKASWSEHARKCDSTNRKLSSCAVKLPHHGSKVDNTDNVLEHFYPTIGEKYAIISANGNKHPHPNILGSLKNKKIFPYCTNLSKACRQSVAIDRNLFKDFDPRLSNVMINNLTNHQETIPCQGDISVCIDDNGKVTVSSQIENSCSFRGNFDFLFN